MRRKIIDKMKKAIILPVIIIVIWLMVGCSMFPEPVVDTRSVYNEKATIHEPLPEPQTFTYNDPYVITKETIEDDPDNVVYQCFEFDDGQELGISLQKQNQYIEKLKALLCSYREELNEAECEPYINQEKDDEVQD